MRTRRRTPLLALLALLVGVLVVLAGCGDSEDSADGAESSSGGDAALIEEARANVETAQSADDTWRGPTTGPEPAEDKTVYVISCSPDTEGCQRDVRAAIEASEVIGWNVKRLDSDGTPDSFVTMMEQAINSGADGLILASFPLEAIAEPLKKAEQKGIPVITMLSGNDTAEIGDDFKGGYFTEVGTSNEVQGGLAADWIIAETEGAAVVGYFLDPAFPILGKRLDAFESRFRECEGCELKDPIDLPLAKLASEGTQAIASFLQANPDVNYFYTFDGAAIFAVQAIEQIGRADDLPLVANDGNAPNLELIRQGKVQVADIVDQSEFMGWAAVDQMNRAFNGEPPAPEWTPEGKGIPTKLLVQDNLPPKGEQFTSDVEFEAHFEELWSKGSTKGGE